MKYYREESTGKGWKPYEKTYITRKDALKLIGETRLIELEGQKKLTNAHTGTASQVRSGSAPMYIGVEY